MTRLLKTIAITVAYFLFLFTCLFIGMVLVHVFGAVPSLIVVGTLTAIFFGYDVYQRLGDD